MKQCAAGVKPVIDGPAALALVNPLKIGHVVELA